MRTYDHFLNSNEGFIILTLAVGYLVIFFLPKRFSRAQTVLAITLGIYLVMLFDNVLCLGPFDFYDINDTSGIDVWDYVSQLMFGPFAYLFMYGCSLIRQNRLYFFLYTAIWALISIFAEALSWHAGVYRYRNHYQMFYSLPIYMLVLTFTLIIYQFFFRNPPLILKIKGPNNKQ
ncbi:MAG: hypothetical protein ACE3JK_05815 [Sporolactobacillus sp.]